MDFHDPALTSRVEFNALVNKLSGTLFSIPFDMPVHKIATELTRQPFIIQPDIKAIVGVENIAERYDHKVGWCWYNFNPSFLESQADGWQMQHLHG